LTIKFAHRKLGSAHTDFFLLRLAFF
jgi:hypothetical protein